MTSTYNPFSFVEIGSAWHSSTKTFSQSVFDETDDVNLVYTNTDYSETSYMTGQSDHFYSDMMNKGYATSSGACGLNGVAKFQTTIAGYIGNQQQSASTKKQFNYNINIISAASYIKFNQIDCKQLLSTLNGSAISQCTKILDIANQVGQASQENQPTLLNDWVKEIDTFKHEFGDGFVCGTVIGAIGGAQINVTNTEDKTVWTYGGESKFSFSSFTSSCNIGLAYDGNNSKTETHTHTTASVIILGKAVRNDVNNWVAKINNQTNKFTIDPLSADFKPKFGDLPKVPEAKLILPKKEAVDQKVDVKKIDAFNENKSLPQTLSVHAGLQQDDKAKSPDEFLQQTKEPADISGLTQTQAQIQTNHVDVLKDLDTLTQSKYAALNSSPITNKAEKPNDGDYVVLGTWIIPWESVFPWMSTAYCNNIASPLDKLTLKWQTMVQDFNSLSNLYNVAYSSGVKLKNYNGEETVEETQNIATQFTSLRFRILNNPKLNLAERIIQAYQELGDYQKIYEIWNSNPVFRNCELGTGLNYITDGKSLSLSSEDSFVDSKKNEYFYRLTSCDYHPGAALTSFSKKLNVFPIITPEGDIYTFGPNSGLLCECMPNIPRVKSEPYSVFSPASATRKPLAFEIFEDKKAGTIFKSKDKTMDVSLIPIPLATAEGIPWTGQSLVQSIACNSQLSDNLTELYTSLSNQKQWILTSDQWENWTPDTKYSMTQMNIQYWGIVEEPRNIFPK